ncbi:MAG TPA: glycosyltransferase family 4 protein, partial [Candidatus Lokiarchaeia archaeon]
FIKKISKKKVVITVHGSDILTIPRNQLIKKIYIGLIKHSDHIIAVSNANKKKLIELGVKEDMIFVIPNGIYLYELKNVKNPKKKKDETKIVWTGRMVEIKGLKNLIKAMKIVVTSYPDSKLALIGDGPLKNNLMNLSEDLCLKENIDFIGYVKNEAILEYLENSDIFVLPSTFEGFGISALEAMNCSKPIIGSNIGGIVDIIEDKKNGLLVEPENHQQLAEKICYLIEHPVDRIRMGKEGRKIAEKNFTWEKIAGKTFELYSKLLKNSS